MDTPISWPEAAAEDGAADGASDDAGAADAVLAVPVPWLHADMEQTVAIASKDVSTLFTLFKYKTPL